MKFREFLNEGRWGINFGGGNDGGWEADVNLLSREFDWIMAAGLSLKNNRKNYSVENATEQNKGFLKALKEIIKKYPDLKDWGFQFDSPKQFTVDELLNIKTDWKDLTFLHGTSLNIWENFISKEGLKPISITGATRAYGSGISNALKSNKNAIYLTTQETMARFAAHDAARVHNSKGVILKISGKNLNPDFMGPDEDSRKRTARESLESMGSIAYFGIIPPKFIKMEML